MRTLPIFPARAHYAFPFAGKEESLSKARRLKGIQFYENLVGENWAKKIDTQITWQCKKNDLKMGSVPILLFWL